MKMKNKLHNYLTSLSPPRPSEFTVESSKKRGKIMNTLSHYNTTTSQFQEISLKSNNQSTRLICQGERNIDEMVTYVVELAEKIKILTKKNNLLIDDRDGLKSKVENIGELIEKENEEIRDLEVSIQALTKQQKSLELADLSSNSQNSINTSFKSEVCKILYDEAEQEGINNINEMKFAVKGYDSLSKTKLLSENLLVINQQAEKKNKEIDDTNRRITPRNIDLEFNSERKSYSRHSSKGEFFSDRKKENQKLLGLKNSNSAYILVSILEERIGILKIENEKIEKIRKALISERNELDLDKKSQRETNTKELLDKMKNISSSPTLERQKITISELKTKLQSMKLENKKIETGLKNSSSHKIKKNRYREENSKITRENRKNELSGLEKSHHVLEQELEDLKRKYWNLEKNLQYDNLMKNELQFSENDLRAKITELKNKHKANIDSMQERILINQEEMGKIVSTTGR